jgi:hypothetical protein
MGDIGAACGQAWAYGGTSCGHDDMGSPYYLSCTWMDRDHGRGIRKHPQPITNR